MDYQLALTAGLAVVVPIAIYLFWPETKPSAASAPAGPIAKKVSNSSSKIDMAEGPRPIDSNHYQWAKDMDRRRQETAALGITYAPQPISPAVVPQTLTPQPVGGSAWNVGGTWEDREISAKATPLLEKAVSTIRMAASDGLHLNFTAVTRCEGVATLIYSRGRAKPGYEYNLSAKWELCNTVDNTLSASGVVELYDIADSESDVFSRMRITVDYAAMGVDRSRCEKVVRDASDDLRCAIRTWADMLKKL